MDNFKHRHGIQFKTEQGEAGAVDVESLRVWQQQVLQDSLAGYSPDDIFNADKTRLFWQLLPNKTIAMKGDKFIGGKKNKERITVLVCVNMSATEKLPLLVIGRSAKPRCFKNHKVPVDYEANKKAWMAGVLFEAQIKKWDNKLQKNDRKVLLYLDNCSAHLPNLKLDRIKVKFFSPNTTALSQVHHRKLLLRVRISEIETGNNYMVSLLDHSICFAEPGDKSLRRRSETASDQCCKFEIFRTGTRTGTVTGPSRFPAPAPHRRSAPAPHRHRTVGAWCGAGAENC